jgi:hypothetical protein
MTKYMVPMINNDVTHYLWSLNHESCLYRVLDAGRQMSN